MLAETATSRCSRSSRRSAPRRSTRQGEEAPVIKLVNVMLMSAISKGASDIHIEPYEKEYRVRYRIDGILYNIMAPPLKMRDAITSRVKIMAKLDIAEKRLPQDGRIKIRFSDDGHAARRSTSACRACRRCSARRSCMRLLDKDKLMLDMTKLGFEPESLDEARDADPEALGHGARHRARPAAARRTRCTRRSPSSTRPETNIMTAEDPVEFNLPGINQVQVRENIGLNFAAALRSLPAPGPQHHPRRRDPRLRDGRDRRQGRAHRPPRAVDAAHQRRAEHDQPPDEHGHRAVPGGQLGQPDLRPAPGAPRLRQLQGRTIRTPPPALRAGRLLARRRGSRWSPRRAPAARSATRPATRAASASTR